MTTHADGPFLTDFDFITVVVSREEIEAEDCTATLAVLHKLTTSPAGAIRFCELVDIVFHGYDAEPRGLSEIPEVRRYVQHLDADFPYWLYFLSKRSISLTVILSCLVSVSRASDGKILPDLKELGGYVTERGFPAMNKVCAFVNCSEQEIERLSNRVMNYLTGDHS
jgi:hypothetical protein